MNSACTADTGWRGFFSKRAVFEIGYVLLVMAVTAAALVGFHHVNRINLWLPIAFYQDALDDYSFAKSIIEGSWYLVNERMGAPFGQSFVYWPINDNLHLAFQYVLGKFSDNAFFSANFYAIYGSALTAIAAAYVLRFFKIEPLLALAAGVFFALLPFHLVYSTRANWIGLYYAIPIGAYLSLSVSYYRRTAFLIRDPQSGVWHFHGWRLLVLFLLCAILGTASGNIYYSYFASFFIFASVAYQYLRKPDVSIIIYGLTALLFLVVAIVVQTLPNIIDAVETGRTYVSTRSPKDVSGLRYLDLFVPFQQHPIPFLAAIGKKYSLSAVDNTQVYVGIGLLGTAGFITLLVWLLRFGKQKWRRPLKMHLAILIVASIIFSMEGGVNYLVGVFVSPEMRALNRIGPYIGFFSIFAIALLLDDLRRRNRYFRNWFLYIPALFVVFSLSIYDAIGGRHYPDQKYVLQQARFFEGKAHLDHLEKILPAGAMIFQLPPIQNFEGPGRGTIGGSDHSASFLQSSTLKFSHGHFLVSPEADWMFAMEKKPPQDMLTALAITGFSGVHVDKRGYEDQGQALIRELSSLAGTKPFAVENSHYVFIDLRLFAKQLQASMPREEWEERRKALLELKRKKY